MSNNDKIDKLLNLLNSNLTFVGHEHNAFVFDKNNKKIIGVNI